MLDLPSKAFKEALTKASGPYGESNKRDLRKAIQRMKENSSRLDDCMYALKMTSLPKAALWEKIRALGNLIEGNEIGGSTMKWPEIGARPRERGAFSGVGALHAAPSCPTVPRISHLARESRKALLVEK